MNSFGLRSPHWSKAASSAREPGSPPVRQLAGDLHLAPGTVARAYQILEATGITQGQRRRGTIVLAQPGGRSAQDNQLMTAARAYVATIRELGLDSATAHAAIDSALPETRHPLHRTEQAVVPPDQGAIVWWS